MGKISPRNPTQKSGRKASSPNPYSANGDKKYLLNEAFLIFTKKEERLRKYVSLHSSLNFLSIDI